MAEKPKSAVAMIIVLTAVAMISGLALAAMSHITKEPIAVSKRAALVESLEEILPPYANEPDRDRQVCKVADGAVQCFEGSSTEAAAVAPEQALSVYPALDKAGKAVGAAFVTSSTQGYGGLVKLLVGVDQQQHVTGYTILEHKETPGLGDNAGKDDPESDRDFPDQFKGKGLDNFKFAVSKDGGQVDAITSATITSRAVTGALKTGLERFKKARGALRAAKEGGR